MTISQLESSAIGLKHLWLEITRRCNLRCLHCYANSSPYIPLREAITTPQWIKVIREAYEEGCRNIQFIGGEPILHPDLELFLRTAKSLGYEFIEVYTNGTCHPSKWLGLFVELEVKLAISFYSTNPEVHDAITGVNGSYHRTLRGIDSALAAGLQVRVGIIQISQTDEEIKSAIEFLKLRGVANIGADRVRHVGRADSDNSYTSLTKQLEQLCGKCFDGNLCVTATGQTYPCIMSRAWPLGDIRDSLKSVINSRQLTDFRQSQLSFIAVDKRVAKSADCSPDDCPTPCDPDPPWCRPYCNPCMPM